jgi:hypothetical protein
LVITGLVAIAGLVAVGLVAEERVADRVCMVRVLVGCCLYYHPVLESRFNFILEPTVPVKPPYC